MKLFVNEYLVFCEVKVTHKVTHILKCTPSFPEFFGVHTEEQQAIKTRYMSGLIFVSVA